ncbi:MAG TPA: PAS domain-containing protein [Phenylobacterium sp.]|nr:PAS domain-containing protein [Phenylobacterium sp.]
MQRFVLQENIRRFQAQLGRLSDAEDLHRVVLLMAAMERELALLDASESGVLRRGADGCGAPDEAAAARTEAIARFREDFSSSVEIAALIDPAPGLVYVDINPAYEQMLGVARGDLVGTQLFEQFPDNPDDPAADGVYKVYMSLRHVAETCETHAMSLQRYDVSVEGGGFVPRYWRIVNSPVLDAEGRLLLLLNTAQEVCGEEAPQSQAPPLG